MYLNGCGVSEIVNNSIKLKNNFITNIDTLPDEFDLPHVDGIQIFNPKNSITISNNRINNKSTIKDALGNDRYDHRQGIYIEKCSVNVLISNNIVISKQGDNCLNINPLLTGTINNIFNNTFIGEGDLNKDVNINNGNFVVNINFLNNIVYKNGKIGSTKLNLISVFDETKMANMVFRNNLYYNSFSVNNKIGSRSVIDVDPFATISDPLLIENNDFYTVTLTSPVKNDGEFIQSIGSDINHNSRPYWQKESYDIGAEELPDAQIKIGVINVSPGTKMIHSLTSYGSIWGSNQFNIDNSQVLKSSSFETTGSNDLVDKKYWDGFTYNWLKQGTNDPNSSCGIGVYRISNSHNPSKYFYLDMRHWRNDADFNPNVNIRFDANPNVMKYAYYKNSIWQYIDENASIVRLWDILNEQPNTAPLNNFWSNALVIINKNYHPLLIWGKYPNNSGNSNYFIFAKNGGYEWLEKFSLTNTFDYFDATVDINNSQIAGYNYQYKIGVDIGDFYIYSNIDKVNVKGNDPAKIAAANRERNSYEYSLSQNYPNPFNPSTVITFTNKSQEHVELKVYDVLGRELRTLLNQEMEPGEHNVTFNAGNLPSGIYFYNIKAGDYTQTHKMILMK